MAEFHNRKEYDPVSGITEEMWYDDTDGKIHVRRTQKVDHIYKDNKRILTEAPRTFSRDDGLYHKARIPLVIIEKWMKEEGFNWYQATDTERRKKLNAHPEFHVRKGVL